VQSVPLAVADMLSAALPEAVDPVLVSDDPWTAGDPQVLALAPLER
jgi:hypothetical protein